MHFIAVPDGAGLAQSQGFASAMFGECYLPSGTVERVQKGLSFIESRRHWKTLEAFLQAVAAGRFDVAIRQADPQLCLIDSVINLFALRCIRLKIPTATYNIALPDDIVAGVPRLASSLMPGGNSTRDAIRQLFRDVSSASYSRTLRTLLGFRLRMDALILSTAEKVGYPLTGIDRHAPYGHMLRLVPEFVLCAQALDFPRPVRPNRQYLGPCVDGGRREFGISLSLPRGKALVYAALGTQSHRYKKHARRLRECLLTVALRMPNTLFLINGTPSSVGCSLPNVHFVNGRQLTILRQATVFITHAGLGSVKEAIMAGVPMVAVPMSDDQFGNAARVVYYGLGVRLFPSDVTAGRLLSAIARIDRREYRARVLEMRERMRPTLEEACGYIERTFALDAQKVRD